LIAASSKSQRAGAAFRRNSASPRGELEVAAVLLHQRLHGVAVGERARARGRPHRVEQIAHRGRRLRHGVVEPVMGEVGKAEQAGALGAQPHHLGDDRLVVGRAAIVAALGEGAKDLFAQIAPVGELQERLDARTRQRDDVAVEAALLRLGFQRLAHEIGQAGELGFAVERSVKACSSASTFWLNAVPSVARRSMISASAFFAGAIERGAGAAEASVVALEHALLLGGKPERIGLAHQRVDAAEQRRVGVDLVPVAGDPRRNLALDFKERVVGVGAGQHDGRHCRRVPAPARSVPAPRWYWQSSAARDSAAMAAISASCSASARA
jgi:hypothetical protein